jgi:hypothetical protein
VSSQQGPASRFLAPAPRWRAVDRLLHCSPAVAHRKSKTRHESQTAERAVQECAQGAGSTTTSNVRHQAVRGADRALPVHRPGAPGAPRPHLLYYRKGEKETATDAADQFLRENPTHPRVDYAWYMKGLIDFERTPYRDRALVRRRHGQAAADRLLKSIRLQHRGRQYPNSDYARRCAAAHDLPAQPPGRFTRSTSRATTSSAAPTWPPRSAHSA